MQKLTEVHLQRDCSIATELLHYLTKGKLPHDFFSEEGWVRVNVDGSVRMGGCQVSCGRVFRNEDGLWMEGFVSNLEVCNVLMAELNAILMWLGRGMCQSCGLKQIQP
ncbi:hypothetical protein JHK87_034218 [Glycine soja]|nr:hypothetical protein JHK87_034218 [Glycine soja]